MVLALATFAFLKSSTDSVSVRFAFFGCNRVEKEDIVTYPSSANEPQLLQNLRDVRSLTNPPQYLFLAGDIVMGYANDKGEVLRDQLDRWNRVVRRVPLPQTTLVPFPGNHEMNRKDGDVKLSSRHTIPVWNEWYRRSGYPLFGENGPSNTPEAQEDQRILSYSFDRENVHFVVLNTDSLTTRADSKTKETTIGWVPTEWVKQDLASAQSNPKTTSIFVLGHRNLLDPSEGKGDAPIDAEAGKQLEKMFGETSKFRGYLCAHVHAWDIKRFGSGHAFQVIAGNGGSRLEKDWAPAGGHILWL